MRRLVVASAILATLLIGPVAPAGAANAGWQGTATDSERATRALDYLLAVQTPDGSIDGSLAETADFVIGAADAGFDPTTLRGCGSSGAGALDYIARASDAATTDAGKTAKAIVAVVAAGSNPQAFVGRDLVGRLTALQHSKTGASARSQPSTSPWRSWR